MNTSLQRLLIGVCVLASLALSGCSRESHVKIDQVTTRRSGQQVSNTSIELGEGQALGIRVLAVKKRTIKERWHVSASSSNVSIMTINEADEKNVFVVVGAQAGTTEITFKFRGRWVYVPVTVVARDAWEPSAPDFSFGGAGGFGGSF